jgi:hypothetical protein
MEVFVVEKGTKHEGGGAVAVFTRLELADTCAQRIMKEETEHCIKVFEVNCPVDHSDRIEAGYGVWKKTSDGPKYWEWQDATESVSIRQMPVLSIVIP